MIDLTLEPGTSHSVPEQVATLEYEQGSDPADVIDISEVSSEGGGGEEEGREAEAVPPMGAGAQRILPVVSVRREGRGGRGMRITPIPIVWDEDSMRGRGGYTRGVPRGGRRARGFGPGPASSSSFNRFLP